MTQPVSPLVSICIPAWERPRLLVEAVESCLAQSYSEIEIVIADDSRSDDVARAVEPLLARGCIRYVRNEPRLGQAGNVNRLFDLARGERLVLLHDDDRLFPDAIDVLDRCWCEHAGVIACYGKQAVISHTGRALPRMSVEFDRNYQRTPERAGIQQSKGWAALVEQMPPDGALIATAAARAVRLRPPEDVGDDCDYDFIVRLAEHPGDFCFVDRYITQYRLTDSGVASRKTVDYTFAIARDMPLPPALEPARESLLRGRAAYAVRANVLVGRRREAWEIVREPRYWAGTWARARVTSAAFLLMPRVFVQAIDSARRGLGRLRRRLDGLAVRP